MENVFKPSCYTHFPLHMGAVTPLSGAEKVQSARAITEGRPGRRGEAEGRAKTILTLADVSGYTVDLSGLPQGGVLDSQHRQTDPKKQTDVSVSTSI